MEQTALRILGILASKVLLSLRRKAETCRAYFINTREPNDLVVNFSVERMAAGGASLPMRVVSGRRHRSPPR